MRRLVQLSMVMALAGVPHAAFADATVFIGATTTPSTRLAKGFAIGVSLLIVGFEFEYSSTSEDEDQLVPSLRTGMVNGLIQTPNLGTIQLYFTAGGGFYRERLEPFQETNFGINTGGGAKIPIAGPLRIRVDYRFFKLYGSPLHTQSQRIYAGANLTF